MAKTYKGVATIEVSGISARALKVYYEKFARSTLVDGADVIGAVSLDSKARQIRVLLAVESSSSSMAESKMRQIVDRHMFKAFPAPATRGNVAQKPHLAARLRGARTATPLRIRESVQLA